MSEFSAVERVVAASLNRYPRVKYFVKALYSYLTFLICREDILCRSDFQIDEVCAAKNSFFGYYDKDPANSRGHVLCHLTDNRTDSKNKVDSIRVAVLDYDLDTILWAEDTEAFSLQQGARLHWLTDDKFIYNVLNESRDRYCSVVRDAISYEIINIFDRPVQDSFKDEFLLSIDFEDFEGVASDYAYRKILANNKRRCPQLVTSGIIRIDLDTNEQRMFISHEDIIGLYPDEFDGTEKHTVNHVMISPNGDKVVFIHRYYHNNIRNDSLIYAAVNGREKKLLIRSGVVSHYCWISNSELFGYMEGPGQKLGYWVLDVLSGDFRRSKRFSGVGDGHPSSNGDIVVTDTYPNKARIQKLMLSKSDSDNDEILGEFFHGFNYSLESRCDLHPRISSDGKFVFFDSVFSGERKLYRLHL